MFRKTHSRERNTTVFQELKKEFSPYAEAIDTKAKVFIDRHAKIIFCVMLLFIVASFILTFFVLSPKSENQAENFKKELNSIPGGLSAEISALQDLTIRAAEIAGLKAEIERIISQDSISKTDSAYLEKAIEQLQYFNNQSSEKEIEQERERQTEK
jgi:preprotein translocase subunit YajC